MKTIIYSSKIKALLIIMLLSLEIYAQCPPDDYPKDYVYLITQEDVDNFIIEYPNCTELKTLLIGDVIPSTITNLNGLINLENVGWLQITNVPITNFQGLNNIHTIDRLTIYYIPDLLSFEGLESLESVTGQTFSIKLCSSISNFKGLENLASFDGNYFTIIDNRNLNDVTGLDCYFFTEEFRNGVIDYYSVQSSLNQSIYDHCGILISSKDDFINNNIHIYPNPTHNNISIDSPKNIEQIDIYDLLGRLSKQIKSDYNSIDLSEFSSGSYILQIRLESNNILNSKLIIE